MLHSSYVFAVNVSLKLHTTILLFELPPSACQLRTLHISFIKFLPNIFALFFIKWNLSLLKGQTLIFLELTTENENVVFST